jgi:hypothetical protein
MDYSENDIDLDHPDNAKLKLALTYSDEFPVIPLHYIDKNNLFENDICTCGDKNCNKGHHPVFTNPTENDEEIINWWGNKEYVVGVKAGQTSYYKLEIPKEEIYKYKLPKTCFIDKGKSIEYFFQSNKKLNSTVVDNMIFTGEGDYLTEGNWFFHQSEIKSLPDNIIEMMKRDNPPIVTNTKLQVKPIKNDDLVIEIVESEKISTNTKPVVQPFWYYNNDKPFIDELKLIEFLKSYGIVRIGDVTPTYARIINGLVEEFSPIQIKDLVMNHLKEINEKKVLALVHKQSESLFGKSKLSSIDPQEINYINDTKNTVHLFYQNVILAITKDKVKLMPYGDGVIHRKSKLNRDFETNNEIGVFEQMVRNTSSYKKPEDANTQPDKNGFHLRQSDLESKMLSLGYLINRHQVDSKAKCIVAIDAFIDDDEINGSTCKSLFFKGIKHIRSVKSFNGKSFRIDNDSFVLEGLKRHHQVLLIDDVSSKFDFELMFNMITDDITINGKYNKKLTIPFNEAPKFCLTTNYPLKKDGTSISRRQHIIEFSDFYNNERNPVNVHGVEFFDWNDAEWNKFDTFMVKCVRKYLSVGQLKKAKIGNYALNKLGNDMGIFLNWAETLQLNQKLNRKELYSEICFEYSKSGKKIGKKQFNAALKSYSIMNGWQYNKHKNGKDDKDRNNNQWITLTV